MNILSYGWFLLSFMSYLNASLVIASGELYDVSDVKQNNGRTPGVSPSVGISAHLALDRSRCCPHCFLSFTIILSFCPTLEHNIGNYR